MNGQIIISIGREYGSAGLEIGQKLAEKLGVKFYDKNILEEIAVGKNVNQENLARYDEMPKKPFGNRTVRGQNNSPEDAIAKIEFDFLKKKAAENESFVVIGRCADSLFKGSVNNISFFITANIQDKINRVLCNQDITERDAIKILEKKDKIRAEYHDSHCLTKWGMASSYDFCVNSSILGIDGTVELMYNTILHYNKD